RLLQERGATKEARQVLEDIAFPKISGTLTEAQRLRGLWALHVTGSLSEELLLRGLGDDAQYMRAWTIQLALEDKTTSPAVLARLETLAKADASPVVRLYLASAAQRLS